MRELFNILLIAIALSMDTFSLSLGLGTYNLPKKKIITISITVGIMHFLMPFLGDILGGKIVQFFSLNHNFFLGCILLFIAANLLFEMRKEEKISLDLSFLGIFLFAFGVSIDAFSTGLGLSAITKNKINAMLVFSVVSFFFTWFGLQVGKIASNRLGKKATILGLILLIYLGLTHILH